MAEETDIGTAPAVPPHDALLNRLEPEPDERAVFSAVYQHEGGELTLRHGSLLIGPPEMSQSSWGKWRSDSTARLNPQFQELSKLPPDILVTDARAEDGTALVAGRVSMDVSEARSLLAKVLNDATVPSVGPLPEASAPVAAPDAFLHVFPRLWTPVSRLAASAARPLRGFVLTRTPGLADMVVTSEWQVQGVTVYDGAWSTVGIAMPYVGHSFDPPTQGLLVGRLERRAWFDDVKGDGTFNLYELHVGLDPGRIDVADLEVELEEWADGGELTNSRRLLLGDLDLGARAGQTQVLVGLPTLGRGLAHEARLYDRDGVLLDRTQRSKLVEQVTGTGRVSGPGGASGTINFTAGQKVTTTVTERLDRLDQLEQDYRELLEKGLDARIVSDRSTAITVIQNHLAAAPGEIWVMDPYFGGKPDDWTVLQGVTAPVKVLSGRGAKKPPGGMTNVHVRRWNGKTKNPLFHDRCYLWQGGGLTVGTSPSGFGNRDARIDRLRATEAEGWRALFQKYWSSGDFLDA